MTDHQANPRLERLQDIRAGMEALHADALAERGGTTFTTEETIAFARRADLAQRGGHVVRSRRSSVSVTQQATHEPDEPINWPHGHVGVTEPTNEVDKSERVRLQDVAVTITGPDADECMMVTLGDHDHYLHSTTTRELSNMLLPFAFTNRAAAVTVHGVSHVLNSKASRSLSMQLQQRLDEWNRTRAFPWFSGV